MNRISISICLIVLFLATWAFSAEEIKLGAVDLPRVVRESEAGKKGAADLKKLYEKYQAQIRAKEGKLDKLQKALLEKGKSLPPEKRSAKEKELQKKFQEYQEFAKNAQEDIAKKESDLLRPIMESLEKLVKDYGRANGYAAITAKGGLVYNDGKYEVKDLSDDILRQFDAAGNKSGVSATSPPPPGRTDAIQGRLSSAGKPAGTDSGRK